MNKTITVCTQLPKIEESNVNEDNLDLIRTGENHYHLIKDGKVYKVQLLKSDHANRSYKISLNNEIIHVKLKSALETRIENMGFSSGSDENEGKIVSPMPGLVGEIMCKVGQKVEKSDPLLILEAMKMENIIKAPKEGIVDSIAVKTHDNIQKNELLLVIN